MGELRLLFLIVYWFFKIIYLMFRGIYRLLTGGIKKAYELGDAEMQKQKAARSGSTQPVPAKTKKAPTKAAAVKQSTRVVQSVTDALRKRIGANIERARALSARADEIAATRRFVPTIDALIERDLELDRVARRGENDGGRVERELSRDELLFEIVEVMVGERRTDGLNELLRDTDALAIASYAPIVEYCTRRGIALSSDRAATVLDGDKLFFLSVDDPTGLAAIVLPDAFNSEIIWWPAVAHEIAHDFYRSVRGLPDELAKAVSLGGDTRLMSYTANRQQMLQQLVEVPTRATTAWREELFADAFGTMMLGPAFVMTMSQLFADTAQPSRACAMNIDKRSGAPHYEEHPPGHVRVVVACRLLGRMGYGLEADRLESAWRKRHGDPENVYVPLADERYLTLPEGPILSRAEEVGTALYMTGFPSLRQQPLRSIPGLDFGPREHVQAQRVCDRLLAGRAAQITDARMLVAGAVLARMAQPKRADDLYVLARMAMAGLNPEDDSDSSDDGSMTSAASVREALILETLLSPPRAARGGRRRAL